MGSGFREKPLAPGSGNAEPPPPDTAGEGRQEEQLYPFEEMLQPEPQAAPAPGQPGQPGQPTVQPRPGAQPAVAPTPPPVVPEEPEPPQEDPEYPFERMLDTPN